MTCHLARTTALSQCSSPTLPGMPTTKALSEHACKVAVHRWLRVRPSHTTAIGIRMGHIWDLPARSHMFICSCFCRQVRRCPANSYRQFSRQSGTVKCCGAVGDCEGPLASRTSRTNLVSISLFLGSANGMNRQSGAVIITCKMSLYDLGICKEIWSSFACISFLGT